MSLLALDYEQDDWQYSEEACDNCGSETRTACCWQCGGEGGYDAYEIDPLWYDQGDTLPCDECHGDGSLHWCPVCNWDFTRPAKWNTPRHRGMAIELRSKLIA